MLLYVICYYIVIVIHIVSISCKCLRPQELEKSNKWADDWIRRRSQQEGIEDLTRPEEKLLLMRRSGELARSGGARPRNWTWTSEIHLEIT